MSRKHFVAIAAAIKAQRPGAGNPPVDMVLDQTLDTLSRELASTLASTNREFNRSRFLAACGVTG